MSSTMGNPPYTIGFIGAGKTATTLAMGLHRVGYAVIAVASRTPVSAAALAARIPGCRAMERPQDVADACRLVFATPPDDAIRRVVEGIHWRPGQGVVHCSGTNSLDSLYAARDQGAEVAAFHPLQTFAEVDRASQRLAGTTFALEGDGELLRVLEEMASRLGGRSILLDPAEKALYHAAAVLSCGYVTTLLQQAVELWQRLGFSREVALQALGHLAQSTVDNIASVGPESAATGPVIRGDIATLEKHLEALDEQAPDLVSLYCLLGRTSLSLARRKGLAPPERLREMERLLLEYESRLEMALLR